MAPVGLAARAVRAPRPQIATQVVRTVREEYYETRWGVGVVRLAGDLPLELEMPDPARRAEGAPRGRWSELLERYFAGEPVEFDLDVDAFTAAHGYTRFERDVAAALARVPRGAAVSYRDLAHAAGRPNAYRAVGSVMARNPLPVILPCHRVIHNDGTLGKYGDDPTWKQRLLRLEGWEPGGETDRLRRAAVAGERRPGSVGGGARRAATGE
jgi:methylated-DNA-[protein]-cysteine S-methyltransferase